MPLPQQIGSSINTGPLRVITPKLVKPAGITLAQPIVSTDTATSLTLAGPPNANDLLVVVAGVGATFNPTNALSTVSGGGVAAWTHVTQNNGTWNGTAADIWYGFVTGTPSATVSFTWGVTANAVKTQASLLDFKGVSAHDQDNNRGSNGQNNKPVTASVTPVVANELFIASASCGAPAGTADATFTSSITSGWTLIGATAKCGLGAYLISADAVAHSATFGLSSALENWVTVISAFKP